LLIAVSAGEQADEIARMKVDLLWVRFDEQMRSEKRKAVRSLIEVADSCGQWDVEDLTRGRDTASRCSQM
jgi:hypothetical protein